MISLLNIVFEIETDGSMQKLVNEVSSKFDSQIEYIQCDESKKVLYVVFRDKHESRPRMKELEEITVVSDVNTDVTLLGIIIKKITSQNSLRKLNPTVKVSN